MTLEEKKQAVIEEFSMYDEWLDKYEYLIELGKALEAYPEEQRRRRSSSRAASRACGWTMR